jgi:hypothetical protein
MRITIKTGLLFAFGWILIKLSIFGMGKSVEVFKFAILGNMLFVILAITVGLYLQKRRDTEEGNALRDIKNGMTAGVPYALVVSAFIYFYYSKIDPSYNQHQIAESGVALEKALNDPSKLKKLKATNPDFEVMTVNQIRKAVNKNSEAVYNAKSTTIMALSAMLLYATLNSIFITIIFRKIVFRKR